MSLAELGRFLTQCVQDPGFQARYEVLPLSDLIFAARCEGYQLQPKDFGGLIGGMEVWRITVADGQAIDAASALWRRMWGRTRLDYVAHELWAAMDPAARAALLKGQAT